MKKNSVKTMVASLVAIVICFAMLLGTTFAWFADSVTSSNNVITSGLLNVNAYWMEGNKDPSVDSNWTEFNGDPIFNYEKWEPGYVEAKHVKIVNEGSLAFKYNLYIITEESDLTKLSPLANVIDVYFLSEAQTITRDSITSARKVGTLAELIADPDGAARGILLPAGTTPNDPEKEMVNSVAVSIAFKMQESAGNEYQGLSLGKFDIGIFATQYEFEEDTFDNAYDTGLTPIEEGDVLVEENGVQYVYNDRGARLHLVTEDFTEQTLVVPEGITNIGNYAFSYNSNVKEVVLPSTMTSLGRGFDSSTVEKVILNEGLETIDSRAFRSTSALEEVVISSTVKTIADNAFQKSAIKQITIPATVETVGETAFGASKIETVIFEGNTSIQGYAFRGCSELRTVYLNGEDVTFIPSTLNGRNSMWFCNGESNNPNTSNITFHVKNETVASRVKTAMGAEANNTPVYVNGVLYNA